MSRATNSSIISTAFVDVPCGLGQKTKKLLQVLRIQLYYHLTQKAQHVTVYTSTMSTRRVAEAITEEDRQEMLLQSQAKLKMLEEELDRERNQGAIAMKMKLQKRREALQRKRDLQKEEAGDGVNPEAVADSAPPA